MATDIVEYVSNVVANLTANTANAVANLSSLASGYASSSITLGAAGNATLIDYSTFNTLLSNAANQIADYNANIALPSNATYDAIANVANIAANTSAIPSSYLAFSKFWGSPGSTKVTSMPSLRSEMLNWL